MPDTASLSGELSNSKIAAVFPDASRARLAAQAVTAALSLGAAQVQVITPAEPHPGRKLEPEPRGIWRTIVRAHARLGLVGAVAGLVAFAALRAFCSVCGSSRALSCLAAMRSPTFTGRSTTRTRGRWLRTPG